MYTNMLLEAGVDFILNNSDHDILNSSLMQHKDLCTPYKSDIPGVQNVHSITGKKKQETKGSHQN